MKLYFAPGTCALACWISLEWSGAEYEVDLSITVTPLGAISRLEHALDGFDEEQRQYRRRFDEAGRRLNSYQSRLGGAFQFAEELGAKRTQLREIEEELDGLLDD